MPDHHPFITFTNEDLQMPVSEETGLFYGNIRVYGSIIYGKESKSIMKISIYFAISVVQGDLDKFIFVLRNKPGGIPS
ncbi:hypothetical protein WISP_121944 [Willisornis vidua]|uniref:Uncharacterized protein n=1 Tax=Willisornis vidua TaxID=1566151 RepID=A0ABQ9CYJ2_9PASS|nr:hypothetical protein WISP_121944 [Willisornis vidua]